MSRANERAPNTEISDEESDNKSLNSLDSSIQKEELLEEIIRLEQMIASLSQQANSSPPTRNIADKAHELRLSSIFSPPTCKYLSKTQVAIGPNKIRVLHNQADHKLWLDGINDLLHHLDSSMELLQDQVKSEDPVSLAVVSRINTALSWSVSDQLKKDFESFFKYPMNPISTIEALASLATDSSVRTEDYFAKFLSVQFKASEDPIVFLRRVHSIYVNANEYGCQIPEDLFWYIVRQADTKSVFEHYRILVDHKFPGANLALKVTYICREISKYKGQNGRSQAPVSTPSCSTIKVATKKEKSWKKPKDGKYCLRCGRFGTSYHHASRCYARKPVSGYKPPGGFDSHPAASKPETPTTAHIEAATCENMEDYAFTCTGIINVAHERTENFNLDNVDNEHKKDIESNMIMNGDFISLENSASSVFENLNLDNVDNEHKEDSESNRIMNGDFISLENSASSVFCAHDPDVNLLIEDSGSFGTIFNNLAWFSHIRDPIVGKEIVEVQVGNGSALRVHGIGTAKFKCKTVDNDIITISIPDAYLVPGMRRNLFSVATCLDLKWQRRIPSADSVDWQPPRAPTSSWIRASRSGNHFVFHGVISPIKHKPQALTCEDKYSHSYQKIMYAHYSLNHLPLKIIQRAFEAGSIRDLPLTREDFANVKEISCDTCSQIKLTRFSHIKVAKSPRPNLSNIAPLGILVCDLAGPFEVPGVRQEKFIIQFMDYQTRYRIGASMPNKNDTHAIIPLFFNFLENRSGHKIKIFKCDGDTVLVSKPLQEFFTAKGIILNYSPPATPQLNGLAESAIKSVKTSIKLSLLPAAAAAYEYAIASKDVLAPLWVDARDRADIIWNRTPNEQGSTPQYLLTGDRDVIRHPCPLGARGFSYVPAKLRGPGVLKYSSVETYYCVFDPSRNSHRTYNASKKKYVYTDTFKISTVDSNLPKPKITPIEPDADPEEPAADTDERTSEPDKPHRDPGLNPDPPTAAPTDAFTVTTAVSKSTIAIWNATADHSHFRQPLPVSLPAFEACPVSRGEAHETMLLAQQADKHNRLYNLLPEKGRTLYNELALHIFAAAEPATTISSSGRVAPSTFQEALRSPDADKWREAIRKELKAMLSTRTWDLVSRPAGRKVIKCRWVFKIKEEDGLVTRYKARLVACGYSQVPGIDFDETYSPVLRYASLRALLAYSATKHLKLYSLDFDNAYLNAEIKEEIYMDLPPLGDMEVELLGKTDGQVCRLRRAIYGLKQSARAWYQLLAETLLEDLGFTQNKADPCLFFHTSDIVVLGCYVDDLVLGIAHVHVYRRIIHILESKYNIKVLGELTWILGMKVAYTATGVGLSMGAYVENMLEKYAFSDMKPDNIPAVPNAKLKRATDDEFAAAQAASVPYQSVVGSLIFLTVCCRPDIAFAVQQVAQHMSKYSLAHYAAVKKICRYLKGTKDLGVVFHYGEGKDTPIKLCAYVDASFAETEDRKSVSGGVVFVNNSPLVWFARLQRIVTLSTTESELVALIVVVQEILWLIKLFEGFDEKQVRPVTVFEDNVGTIAIAKHSQLSGRTKHIDLRHKFLQQEIESGAISVEYVETLRQIADILTKALPFPAFAKFRNHLVVVVEDVRKALAALYGKTECV